MQFKIRVSAQIIFCAFFLAVSSNARVLPQSAQVDDIDRRIKRQTLRINRGLNQGLLKEEQATQLKSNLKDIAAEAAAQRKQAGGKLSQTHLTKLENQLSQNSNNINTQTLSSKRMKESGKILGPAWQPGEDGAQNPKKLRKQMKSQEQRQLNQYDQAMQQVQELQQQEYEKQMLQKLGGQRPQILQNKEDTQQIRKDTGAD